MTGKKFNAIVPFLEDTENMSENMKLFINGYLAKNIEVDIYHHFFESLKDLDSQRKAERDAEIKSELSICKKKELEKYDIDHNNLTFEEENNLNKQLDTLEHEQNNLKKEQEELVSMTLLTLNDLWDFMAMIYYYQSRLNDRIGRYPYDYYAPDDVLLGYIYDEFKLAFDVSNNNVFESCFNEYANTVAPKREPEWLTLNEGKKYGSFRTYFRKTTFERYHELYSQPNPKVNEKVSYERLLNKCYAYNKVIKTNRCVCSDQKGALKRALGIPNAGFLFNKAEVEKDQKPKPQNKDQLYILCILLGSGFKTFNQLREALTYEYLDENIFADNNLTNRDRLIQSVIRTYDEWCETVKDEYYKQHGKKYDEWDKDGKWLPYYVLCNVDKKIARSRTAELGEDVASNINDMDDFEQCIGKYTLLHKFMMNRTNGPNDYKKNFEKEANIFFTKDIEEYRRFDICQFLFSTQEKYIKNKDSVKKSL